MEFLQKRGNKGLKSKTKEPHFFKIVLEGTLRDGKLGVPKKFVTKYGHNLSNPSLLTVPRGEIWQVQLAKSDDEMWYFEAGWKEFAEFHSLANGHFLVFQYKGGSHFHVLIFDTSATEIDYPINIINGDKGPQRGGRFQETSVENPTTDVDSPAQQSKANTGARCMPARKNGQKKITPRSHSLAWDEKINAYSRARFTFKSNNPFFMIAMQPSYVYPHLHKVFARKYFKQPGNAVLCGLDGRSWSVGHNNNRFSKGWKKFAQDNHLEVGDICIFELTKGTKSSFNVVVWRAVQGGN